MANATDSMPHRGYAYAVSLAIAYGQDTEGWWSFHRHDYGALMLDACRESVAMDAARARMADWRRRRALLRGDDGR